MINCLSIVKNFNAYENPLKKYLFSDSQQKSDKQMWAHFYILQETAALGNMFNRIFLKECHHPDELMEKSIIHCSLPNPGNSIIAGEMGVLSVEGKSKE